MLAGSGSEFKARRQSGGSASGGSAPNSPPERQTNGSYWQQQERKESKAAADDDEDLDFDRAHKRTLAWHSPNTHLWRVVSAEFMSDRS